MKHRFLAFICVLTLLVGLLAGTAMLASAESQTYMVGYAITDINPWVDYTDHSQGIQTGLFNLTGNQNDSTRPLEGLYDDNNDGSSGDGDGIFAAVTAVTDSAGTTVIYITVDSLQGYSSLTKDCRTKIVEALGSDVISADQIMLSASHSHSSVSFDSLASDSATDAQKAYYQHVVTQIANAAIDAYNSRAAATVSKGTVDAKEATAALEYNSNTGYHMNAIRRYQVSAIKNYTIFPIEKERKEYIVWSGDVLDTTEYEYDAKEYISVEESDNDMHVLMFSFKDSSIDPVLFVNWRAHTTMNSGADSKKLSSDYVNGLRTVLAEKGYRAAFFQGAAGNVVTAARSEVWNEQPEMKDWLQQVDDEVGSSNRTSKKTYIYGRMLAEIADYCVKNKMNSVEVGEIRTSQITWRGEKQQDSDGLRAAAAETYVQEAAGTTINYPFSYTWPTSEGGDGKTYILNSGYHRNSVNSRASAAATFTDLELNVIMLGEGVAFVTAPNELVDKFYTYSEGEIFSNDKNDWNNLISDAYGTPFVLGYTNGGKGYIANWLDHTINSQTYTDITGYGENGEEFFSPGIYESNTSRFAQGQGEKLLTIYQRMIATLNGDFDREAPCQHCSPDENVTWKPLFAENAGDINWVGHLYLAEDLKDSACRTINTNDRLCLDLYGHTIESENRAFNTRENSTSTPEDESAKNAIVSIMDSIGGGGITGNSASNNLGGGAIKIAATNVLNIYGGTFQFNNCDESLIPQTGTGHGGVMSIGGVLNMYGGTIIGAKMHDVSQRVNSNGELVYTSYTGRGGAVYLSGTLNMHGGSITSGSVPDEVGMGPCVYMASANSRIYLLGDANVEDIYYSTNNGKQLTVSGAYTGTAGLTFGSGITANMDIGNSENADLTGATITCTNNPLASVYVCGTDLRLPNVTEDTVALIHSADSILAYDSLTDAVTNFNSGYIKLIKVETNAVSVSKDAYLDLAGNNVTNKVTVASGKNLYVMDSNTDDYTVKDGEGYGKITAYEGAVAGVPVEADCAEDGYLMITEEDGSVSFHRVNLQLKALSLRSEVNGVFEPALYYKSDFAGDEIVAENVKSFGVALSVSATPDKDNLETKCQYSSFEGFTGGVNATKTGTLLKGIMKTANAKLINSRNANIPIYGRAYVLLNDGNYMFGEGASQTLRQEIEAIDTALDSLEETKKTPFIKMCQNFISVMEGWDINNIREEIRSAAS